MCNARSWDKLRLGTCIYDSTFLIDFSLLSYACRKCMHQIRVCRPCTNSLYNHLKLNIVSCVFNHNFSFVSNNIQVSDVNALMGQTIYIDYCDVATTCTTNKIYKISVNHLTDLHCPNCSYLYIYRVLHFNIWLIYSGAALELNCIKNH